MMKKTLAAVALLAAIPAAWAQWTGVSHPEQVPVKTSPEAISQPVVYQGPVEVTPLVVPAPAPAATPALKMRTSASERDDALSLRAEDRASNETPVQPDPDANIVMRIEGPGNQLPVGTVIQVKMQEGLSTTATAVGKVFHATLTEAVERDGRVLLPAGAVIVGRVTDVHGGKRISGAASIHLLPQTVTLPDGTRYAIRCQVIDTDLYHSTKVDEEGTIIRKDHAGKTVGVMALTTGAGAVAGAMVGGGVGAVVGAGIGAGVSTTVWLKQDRQTELPAGTRVTFALTGPLVVGAQ